METSLYSLPSLSSEQYNVITKIKEGFNVKVSGVAGCGKTTTILGVCQSNQDKNILVLTYNARLKIETREKADKLGLDNTEIHSYHAMCVRYYSRSGNKDDGIIKVVSANLPAKKPLEYDIIILDECQDMTKLYYKFVMKIIKDNKPLLKQPITLCIFGDEHQNIFDFKGADERFLTYGPQIFESTREWKELTISTSYRVTNQIAGFVNRYLVGYDKVKAVKNGMKVRYLYMNSFDEKMLFNEVMHYLMLGYTYNDIFILAPSIKRNTQNLPPIIKLENILVKHKIPCFAPVSDESKVDEDVIKDKIVFSTFHQVKGLERPIVIMFNFDYSYFKYYGRNLQKEKCPNTIYVATTRAMCGLSVIHHHDNEAILSSITYDRITKDKDILVIGELISKHHFHEHTNDGEDRIKIAVTNLLRFMEPNILHNAVKHLEYIIEKGDKTGISLPQKIDKTKNGTAEIVYDINGYAIPAFYEINVCNSISIMGKLDYNQMNMKQQQKYNQLAFQFGQGQKLSSTSLLYLSTLYDAYTNGYKHRTQQILSYDWLSQKDFEDASSILQDNIGNISNTKMLKFEYQIQGVDFFNTNYIIQGVIDIINYENKTLWEIKCTNSIDNEHVIQLAIYAWMMTEITKNNKNNGIECFKLLNVCTNTQLKLLYNHTKTSEMIDYLLKSKYVKNTRLTDTEFIKDCLHSFMNK
jgi:nucleoside-triphosphatase THEP1